MSVAVFVLLTLLAGVVAIALIAVGLVRLAGRAFEAVHRARHQRSLTEREVALTQRPFAEVSVWPSRAPRNGVTHEGE